MALRLATRRPLRYVLPLPPYKRLQYSLALDRAIGSFGAQLRLNIVKRQSHEVGPTSGRGNAYADRPHPPSPSRFSTLESRICDDQPFEIDADDCVNTVTFTANGEHLVGGTHSGVRVWGVKDGKQVTTMQVGDDFSSVAASRDGRWIAGGSRDRQVLVWDTTTHEQVYAENVGYHLNDIDFSPDSTRLVTLEGKIATIWDIASHRKVQTLDRNEQEIRAAEYSPGGDRIATTTHESVQVWDSNDGRLLVDIKVKVRPKLLWHNNHLYVLTGDNKIMQINSATGKTISELSVPAPGYYTHIAMPQNGKFIACATKKSITFWDTETQSQFGPIQHTDDIDSIACSPNGQLLAIASERRIVLKVTSSIILPFASDLELGIDSTALDAWKHGQLTDADALLSAAISKSKDSHHVLASRALVRARLGHWDAALVDAKESVAIQRSLVGHVAKCMALIGMGKEDEGFRVYDIAFHHLRSEHGALLLVIKAVVLFMAGKHVDAISRIDDLCADMGEDLELCVVQAYMHLLLGNTRMENGDYELAIQSFEDAQLKLGDGTRRPPLIISLISGWTFDGLVVTIQQRLCEAFSAAGRALEAGESSLRTADQQADTTEPIKSWVPDFKYRCRSRLEDLGDRALHAEQYDEAVSQYTAAMSLDPASPHELLVKRSKAYVGKGKWKHALNDANEAIKLDPSSPLGYERKYAAQYGMRNYDDATHAFETMLSKMSESSDPGIRERSLQYVRPEQTKEVIGASIENVIRNLPAALINTSSGRLCNKSQQAAAFELTPAFTTLITSMTTQIDHDLIEKVVGGFYRYATLSHTWEGSEPLYENVIKNMVYDLDVSPTHKKLRMFCEIVRDEGVHWAWSDTCCIDKGDHFVLQEALVSMFKWYEASVMTIIFLFDVDHLAELGALTISRWNSRGWTLQEYHASKVVRIYTKDWTPYLNLATYNHKESPEIISEMEKATGISAEALMALRPGLSDIREKLRLASSRRTTRVEDSAYSLLGIFSMSLPVTYGEGDNALGRLLSQLLTSSGDTSILAWTGTPGSFNSCLPTNINVFSQPATLHIPPALADTEMESNIAGLRASALDLALATKLYDQLNALPLPLFAVQRMKLPCLAFKIDITSTSWGGTEHVFRAQAGVLGVVDIKTSEDLSRLSSLYLIHPWIDFLLDRQPVRSNAEPSVPKENGPSVLDSLPDALGSPNVEGLDTLPLTTSPTDQKTRVSRVLARLRQPFDARSPKPTPENTEGSNGDTPESAIRVYEFLARLNQPFGALLLTPTRQNVAEYRRIAAQSLITVRVEEFTSPTLEKLIQGVQVLDVL